MSWDAILSKKYTSRCVDFNSTNYPNIQEFANDIPYNLDYLWYDSLELLEEFEKFLGGPGELELRDIVTYQITPENIEQLKMTLVGVPGK